MSHSSCTYVEHERGNLFLQTRTNKQKVKHERGLFLSLFSFITLFFLLCAL
ncbi:hypothetical protein HanXRQr2_Chr15g0681971 [Helianthus annuus]|uniref:Uncharacterized protein n=1 Tax=Helianthus annuus TaxID=4232 RepID=A0A9K3H1D9_HELAN|nr:hypothetical protein HanXRQr2_Chr15g0681971 [Helianthus annuus]KAJ0472217.1 hypothetical protein HanHA89_Chr15g0604531 [Helianthus annuus]KAJ0647814.1 hypothetical protein HanLR1_Chr15g0565851 [Helianthus annuus]KAJ0651679.1 hypothetical protein HanOQP8_Chr15g0563571 [Helianthus annuus]